MSATARRVGNVSALFTFPNPVNEVAARTVAAGVALLAILTVVLSATLGTGWLWLTAVIAAGFIARVASGPRFSPLGQLATRVIAPAIGHEKLVAGPPKRFAQAMGAVMSSLAAVLHFGFGWDTSTFVLLALIIGAATLESAFAYCIGCRVFAGLMKLGVIPEETCAACANISLRLTPAA
jgi:hypothetical protein